ncbi:MAG: alpha/beta hydrolase, partial [Bifidobacterium mongoliense]|nr:alpha/beta hydrolase [Bifidobacterium mongoliense]
CRRRAGYDLRAVDCLKALRGSRIPTLFITAGRDHVVDPRDADRLFAACTADIKERLFVADAIHGECQEADPRTYWTAVRDFLSRCLW